MGTFSGSFLQAPRTDHHGKAPIYLQRRPSDISILYQSVQFLSIQFNRQIAFFCIFLKNSKWPAVPHIKTTVCYYMTCIVHFQKAGKHFHISYKTSINKSLRCQLDKLSAFAVTGLSADIGKCQIYLTPACLSVQGKQFCHRRIFRECQFHIKPCCLSPLFKAGMAYCLQLLFLCHKDMKLRSFQRRKCFLFFPDTLYLLYGSSVW